MGCTVGLDDAWPDGCSVGWDVGLDEGLEVGLDVGGLVVGPAVVGAELWSTLICHWCVQSLPGRSERQIR